MLREAGERAGEARSSLAQGEASRARRQHSDALSLASRIDDKYQQARAQDGIARSYHAIGDRGQARRHWQEALTLYTSLGTPEAGQIRARLAESG